MTIVEVTGVKELAVEFELAAVRTLPEVAAVVARGALQVKKDAQRRWKGNRHAPALPYAVGYDMVTTLGSIGAEIGPDKNKRQGALGNLLEYGSINNSPIPALGPALDAEAPRLEVAMAAMVDKLMRK